MKNQKLRQLLVHDLFKEFSRLCIVGLSSIVVLHLRLVYFILLGLEVFAGREV